jgi:DNA-binding SARP family transcriptional activator/tetratricopeptide (TPR) repeat protein
VDGRVVMRVEVRLLGGFSVCVDGHDVAPEAWARRHAATLVKVLALAPNRRLHREQLIDAVWPDDTVDDAAPKLHKAAHYARRALGHGDALVLGGEMVQLFPGTDVDVDAVRFDDLARTALAAEDRDAAAAALAVYRGELAPDDRYESWAIDRREQLHARYVDLLRLDERWDDLLDVDPSDEVAHVGLMRRHLGSGDRHAGLRQYERLDRALGRELGVSPGAEASQLRDRLLALAAPVAPASTVDRRLVGRDRELARIADVLADASPGRSRAVLLSGPPGIGKSAVIEEVRARASARGWRVGHGAAAAVERPWAYAAVVEALADLCRRHPVLLDGLADSYRLEIDRVLAGADASWSGETGHQRLFVAASQLVRLAAGSNGVLLTIDDVHDSDEASLRLLHYLARATVDHRVAFVLSHRPITASGPLWEIRSSLVARHGAVEIELGPLDDAAIRSIVAAHVREPADGVVEQIAALSGGVPFTVGELARRAAHGPSWVSRLDVHSIGGLAPVTREVLQRVAVVGVTFDTDEFVALSGLDEHAAYEELDRALDAALVEPTPNGYRFRHGLLRDALLAEVAPHRRRLIHRDAARRLESLAASPARVGHHLIAAGEPARAVAHVLRAAESEAAIGAYRDALELVETVRAYATGDERTRLLALRADLLTAVGDQAAVAAYRDAVEVAAPEDRDVLRARLARAAVMSGDLQTATAVMADVGGGVDGDVDVEVLLARANVAFFASDFETAWAVAEEARRRVHAGDKSWQVLDLVSLQGLLAHRRGEWFDRMALELRRTRDTPQIANAVFDGHLCAAEYMLYGPTPYAEVIELANALRTTATRSGALRAVAFATALVGEAASLSGDLELAARELREAADLHHDLGSDAGEAHSLQRLAEVRLAQGDADAARELLEQALPLGRWSMMAGHLLQRTYGTLIMAAPDDVAARAAVDRAEAALGIDDWCHFCTVMLAVPATIACARSGDLGHAHHHLEAAERSATLWQGTAWDGWLAEAAAHVAEAEGREDDARASFELAAVRFQRSGQPRDVERCTGLAAAVAH